MTRHQRRKLARARKEAKAALLNSRALHLLNSGKLKANLTERKPTSVACLQTVVVIGFNKAENKFTERSKVTAVSRRPTSPRGLGNRGIYQGMGLYPAPGYGTGAFKEQPLSERSLRELRALDKR